MSAARRWEEWGEEEAARPSAFRRAREQPPRPKIFDGTVGQAACSLDPLDHGGKLLPRVLEIP